ncbi:hypothetical protein GCM10009675_48850 [Prauserella alba]|uniref:Uncharacterized protein n=1 Tax=Prauserella alba TaxID=176898 RepID=A0ABN1VUG9_9PSEU
MVSTCRSQLAAGVCGGEDGTAGADGSDSGDRADGPGGDSVGDACGPRARGVAAAVSGTGRAYPAPVPEQPDTEERPDMRYSARCTGRVLAGPSGTARPSGHPDRAVAPRRTGPEIVVAVSEPERESRT